MKSFLLSLALLATSMVLVAQSGYHLDQQFDGDGYFISNRSGADRSYDGALLADGRMVSCGFSGNQCAVWRNQPNGSPDLSFGAGGTVLFAFDQSPSAAYVLLLNGNKILLAGKSGIGIGIARLLENGQPDPSFDSDGKRMVPAPKPVIPDDETPMAMALQPDGKILLAFVSTPDSAQNSIATVLRFLDNGALDPGFSGDGRAYFDLNPGKPETIGGLQIRDDRIYVGGTIFQNNTPFMALCCLTSDGSPDLSFGTGGRVIGQNGICSDLELQQNGRLLSCGYVNDQGARYIDIQGFKSSGVTDSSFASQGVLKISNYSPIKLNGAALDVDDAIWVAGYHGVLAPFSFFMSKFTKDGGLTLSFGNSAPYFQEKINGTDEEIHNLVVSANGAVTAFGYYENSSTGEDMVLIRLNKGSTAAGGELTFFADPASCPVNGKIEIPIRVKQFIGVDGFQFSLRCSNPQAATFDGIAAVNPTISAGFFDWQLAAADPSVMTCAWVNAQAASLNLPDSAILFTLQLNSNGGNSTIAFEDSPLAREVVNFSGDKLPAQWFNGSTQAVQGQLAAKGLIVQPSGTVIPQVTVTKIENGVSAAVSTNAQGEYNLPFTSCTSFELKPEKNSDVLNGVSILDLVKLSRHLQGVEILPYPYKRIAADIKPDGVLDQADFTQLLNTLLGANTVFPGNKSWRFVPNSHVFPAAGPTVPGFPESIVFSGQSASLSALDFTGIKIGDLNNSAMKPMPAMADLHLLANDLVLVKGKDIYLSLQAETAMEVEAIQLSLYIPENLHFTQVKTGVLSGWRYHFAEKTRILTLIHLEPQGRNAINPGEVLCRIALRPQENGNLLSASVRMENGILIRSNLDFQESLQLTWRKQELTPEDRSAEQMPAEGVSVYPNPFNDEAQLRFYLPETGEVRLQIFDVQGRLLLEKKQVMDEGWQQIALSAAEIGQPGHYWLKLGAKDLNDSAAIELLGQ